MTLGRSLALALLSAALLSTAARPFAPGWLALVALVPLLSALATERRLPRAALLGAVTASGGGLVAFEGVLPMEPWAYPVLVVLASVPGAITAVLFVIVTRRLGGAPALAAYPLLVGAAEFVAGQRWLFGDLANTMTVVGASQFDTPLRLAAAWSGVTGVGILVAAANASLVAALRWRRFEPLAAIALLTVLAVVLPAPGSALLDRQRPELRVAVVQGAVSSIDTLMARFDPVAAQRVLASYGSLTAASAARGAELIVWGETVVPRPLHPGEVPEGVAAALSSAPRALVGAVSYVAGRSYNSVFHWQDGELHEVYRKRALVPLNERSYTAGQRLPPLDVRGVPIGLGVCLDSVFGSLAREAVRAGARVLITVTEDSFAGRTVTPEMHLRLSAFRAVETGRWLVFANQSGPSAVVDNHGRVIERLALGQRAALLVDVPAYEGLTPYVRFGDWAGLLATVAVASVLLLAAVRTPAAATDNP